MSVLAALPTGDAPGVALATVLVLAVWAGTALVLVGLGRHLQLALGLERLTADRVATSLWCGWAVAIAFLQLWNLALPAATGATVALGLGGAAGLARSRRALADAARGLFASRTRIAAALLLGGLAAWLANVATGPCLLGDTGMYHLPMARWLASYPAVPGLANLHGRFGFNNSNLLVAALFESGPFVGRSHHFVQGPLVLAFAWSTLAGLVRWLRPRAGARASDLFLATLLAPAAYGGLSRHATSLSTDLPAALLLLFATWRLLRLVEERAEDDPRFEATLVVTLLVTAATTKLPAAPFAALAGTLAVVVAGRRIGWRRSLVPALLAALVLAVPWVARGVLLSGYPLYPLTLLPAPVEWRVPAEQARAEHGWALDSSRASGRTPGGPWLAGWIAQRGRGILAALPAALALTWTLVLALLAVARRSRCRAPGATSWVVLACLGAAALWFGLGPNPRFGFGVLWALAGACAALAARACPSAFERVPARATAAALSLACLAYTIAFLTEDEKLDWRERWWVRTPGADVGLHPYPEIETEDYVTETGLTLVVPRRSNNTWGTPLPGTPYPAPNLRLRRPGELASGFAVEGAWRAERWPKEDSDYLERWHAARDAAP